MSGGGYRNNNGRRIVATTMSTAPREAMLTIEAGPNGGMVTATGEEICWEEVTPLRAQCLLETAEDAAAAGRQKPNRHRRDAIVAKYAADMKAGRWHSSAPIRIYGDGTLHEGQHRCAACVSSGAPFWTYVIYNSMPESHAVIDSGVKRTGGDYLHWRGEVNTSLLAAVIALANRWDRGTLDRNNAACDLTNQELADWLEANPSVREATIVGQRIYKSTSIPPRVGSTFYFRAAQVDSEAAEVYSEKLISGALLQAGDPVLALRNWFMRRQGNEVRGMYAASALAMMCKAWNFAIRNRSLHTIKWGDGEAFPELIGRNGRIHPFPNTAVGTER